MNRKTLRNLAFILHRYIGLVVGVLLIIAGLTGSLLVFSPEIDEFLLKSEIGQVIPSGQRVSIESVLDTVKAAYSKVPKLKVQTIYTPKKPDAPYQLNLEPPEGETTEVYVNPYTGAIMASLEGDRTFTTFTLELHEQLLAGETGTQIMGVAALLLFILSITGIILWPGWRRLISGFKVKWKNAHPKRVNFDIHKVVGIIAAVFLALTGFTGFYLNFRGFVTPIIYAITFTHNSPDPVSQPIAGSTALSLTQLLQKADAALPNTVTTAVYLPQTPEAAIYIRKKYSHEEAILGRSGVYLDQYTGKTIQIKDALKKSLGDKVLDSFILLHFGTFGGLPTRILYVFVGLAPLILLVTGFVMWWYRYRAKTVVSHTIEISQSGRN
ncbi:MAG: PepSY-associated TM helix domain-containing protein [Nostoc sp.]|uniref:PepSY-associated TM helix domain-containing protein n=1 Tax=Nostoc sp. TaxID=1180 RepID=UPI002FF8BB21